MNNIVFYETESGRRPAEEFLDSLPVKLGAKAVRDLDLLARFGRALYEPYSKHLRDGIFELRTQFSGDAVRIFYFFFEGDNIVLTHGIIKKTQKTPAEELERALRYKSDHERRNAR